jgi:Sec-independent protein translocase protein TatA
MIKVALIVLLVVLIFGAGGQRLRELMSTAKKLPADFKRAKARADDPVAAAKEVRGSAVDVGDPPP